MTDMPDSVRETIVSRFRAGGDGARCHRCGHYETSYERAESRYAHCPSCGRHTRWLRVAAGSADPNPTSDEWRVVDSYSTGGGVLNSWRALGPWRSSEEEARRDAEHGSMRGALPEPPAPDGPSVTLVARDGRCSGAPTVGVSRLRADMILGAIRRGLTDEQILESWPTLMGGTETLLVLRRLQDELQAEPVPTVHDWVAHEREGWSFCSRCGMVRNYDRETPCRGALQKVLPREEQEPSASVPRSEDSGKVGDANE